MLTDEKLSLITNLQKFILSSEDTGNLISSFAKELVLKLNGIGLNIKSLEIVLLEGGKIKSSFEGILNFTPNASYLSALTNPTATKYGNETLICYPSLLSQNQKVAICLFCENTAPTFIEDNKALFEAVVSLSSLAFKLQDTQTSLTQISQEVYKMNAELHELDKLKDDFVSVASHELRTPMTAIRSYAWMALYKSDVPLSEKMKKYLSRTLISTERLINLVNDMLNISRIETGRIEIVPAVFDLKTLVNDVLYEVKAKAQEKSIRLAFQDTNVPKVFGDADKVHQVLLNLIGNALKFTPLKGTIQITFSSESNMLVTCVKDSGVGIAKDDLPRLFKKFGRLDNSYVSAATSGGTGLGLYICKSLIELMKGKIWAQSEGSGEGTHFYFSLPIATNQILLRAKDYTVKVTGEIKQLEPIAV